MATQLEASRRYFEVRQLLLAASLRLADTSWRRVAPDAIDATWAPQVARMLPTLAALQERSARTGAAYVGAALAEQGIEVDAPSVRSTAFAGVASDGRRLDTLLLQPAIDAKIRIGNGATATDALAASRDRLRLIVATQIQDAGRQAAGVAIAARPRVGWVRQLNPPSCSRCAVLAGKEYRWNQGFQRHRSRAATASTSQLPRTSRATSRPTRGPTSTASTRPHRTRRSPSPARRRSGTAPISARSSTPAGGSALQQEPPQRTPEPVREAFD